MTDVITNHYFVIYSILRETSKKLLKDVVKWTVPRLNLENNIK